MEVITVQPKAQGLEIDINREQFALSLKTYRLRQGLTQAQIASRWGTSRFTIIRAENAKPISWEAAYRLFAHLSQELRQEASQAINQ